MPISPVARRLILGVYKMYLGPYNQGHGGMWRPGYSSIRQQHFQSTDGVNQPFSAAPQPNTNISGALQQNVYQAFNDATQYGANQGFSGAPSYNENQTLGAAAQHSIGQGFSIAAPLLGGNLMFGVGLPYNTDQIARATDHNQMFSGQPSDGTLASGLSQPFQDSTIFYDRFYKLHKASGHSFASHTSRAVDAAADKGPSRTDNSEVSKPVQSSYAPTCKKTESNSNKMSHKSKKPVGSVQEEMVTSDRGTTHSTSWCPSAQAIGVDVNESCHVVSERKSLDEEVSSLQISTSCKEAASRNMGQKGKHSVYMSLKTRSGDKKGHGKRITKVNVKIDKSKLGPINKLKKWKAKLRHVKRVLEQNRNGGACTVDPWVVRIKDSSEPSLVAMVKKLEEEMEEIKSMITPEMKKMKIKVKRQKREKIKVKRQKREEKRERKKQRKLEKKFIQEGPPWQEGTASSQRDDNRAPEEQWLLQQGPRDEADFANMRMHGLFYRSWQDYPANWKTRTARERKKWLPFTVASYNILAQNLLVDNMFLYQHCDPQCLAWEHRRYRIMEEIHYHKPDIVCMQEVNENHYRNFFIKKMKQLGYGCVYKKRRGDKEDGCATFYHRKKFSLHTHKPVDYYRPGVPVLDRDNVGLITVLEHGGAHANPSQNIILVANTHLLFNPKRGDIKLAQLMVLFSYIDRWAAAYLPQESPDKPVYCPIILCGDFNLEQDYPIYDFIVNGKLCYENMQAKTMAGPVYGGGQNLLGSELIPKSEGITDLCQRTSVLQKRIKELFARNESDFENCVKQEPNPSTSTANIDVMIVEQSSTQTGADTGDDIRIQTEAMEVDSKGTVKVTTEPIDVESNENVSIMAEPIDVDAYSESVGTGSADKPINIDAVDKIKSQLFKKCVQSDTADYSKEGPFTDLFVQGSGTVQHKLNLQPVYSGFEDDPSSDYYGQPVVSTHHSKANVKVDFIFYSSQEHENKTERGKKKREHDLLLCSTLKLLTGVEMCNYGGLPNDIIGSDHHMLMAKFALKLKPS